MNPRGCSRSTIQDAIVAERIERPRNSIGLGITPMKPKTFPLSRHTRELSSGDAQGLSRKLSRNASFKASGAGLGCPRMALK